MTLASIVRTRLILWREACDAWGFEITPPFSADTLAMQPGGQVAFRAGRTAGPQDPARAATLTVVEVWAVGGDPLDDRRLEHEGCHLVVLSWHLQLDERCGATVAERLDVVPHPSESHPRIHRHPYGKPNSLREPSELPPPDAWLHSLDRRLGGVLSAPKKP